jgi:hypothetical protein
MAEDRANNSVRVVDPRVHRGRVLEKDNLTSGARIVRRDKNESGPMVPEQIAERNRKHDEMWVDNSNKQDRENGKVKVVKIDSGK